MKELDPDNLDILLTWPYVRFSLVGGECYVCKGPSNKQFCETKPSLENAKKAIHRDQLEPGQMVKTLEMRCKKCLKLDDVGRILTEKEHFYLNAKFNGDPRVLEE